MHIETDNETYIRTDDALSNRLDLSQRSLICFCGALCHGLKKKRSSISCRRPEKSPAEDQTKKHACYILIRFFFFQ